MQSFGATLRFDLHFLLFNGIIQTILVAFSMKTSRACAGMLSYENDAFKFSKTAKKHKVKQHVHHMHHSSRARGTGSFLQTSPAVDHKHERKSSCRAVLYIFQNIKIWILATFH